MAGASARPMVAFGPADDLEGDEGVLDEDEGDRAGEQVVADGPGARAEGEADDRGQEDGQQEVRRGVDQALVDGVLRVGHVGPEQQRPGDGGRADGDDGAVDDRGPVAGGRPELAEQDAAEDERELADR